MKKQGFKGSRGKKKQLKIENVKLIIKAES